jgi:hypothetical protein
MAMSHGPVGDRAGEHMHMEHGRYSAWAYVVIGFIYEALFLGATLGLLAGAGVGKLIQAVNDNPQTLDLGIFVTAALVGIGGAYFVFRDRWKVNEALSSRFCSGVANLSMLYVPIVSVVYANVRGVKKLFRG